LLERNKQRNRQLLDWMSVEGRKEQFSHLPVELLPSLIIGATESYSRAWLSGRVEKARSSIRTFSRRLLGIRLTQID